MGIIVRFTSYYKTDNQAYNRMQAALFAEKFSNMKKPELLIQFLCLRGLGGSEQREINASLLNNELGPINWQDYRVYHNLCGVNHARGHCCKPSHSVLGSIKDNSLDEYLGCIFLQESSRILCFQFLWHFFHRNHVSCSAVTFSERHWETCLYGAYVGSYVGNEFGRQKTLLYV